MQAVKRTLAIAVLAFLSACVSLEYQAAGDLSTQGHSTIQIGEGLYKVSYVSVQEIYPVTVETFALRRAAELAIETGRSHFLLESMQTTDNSSGGILFNGITVVNTRVVAFTTELVARLLSAQEASQVRGKTVYDAELLLPQLVTDAKPVPGNFLVDYEGIADYASYQINQNTWQVCHMSTKQDKSAQHALKKAAELALAQGRTHFALRDERMLSTKVPPKSIASGGWRYAATLLVEPLGQAEAKRVKDVQAYDAQAVLLKLQKQEEQKAREKKASRKKR